MNTENRLWPKTNSLMGEVSKGKQWISSMGQTFVDLREELAWEFGGSQLGHTSPEIHLLFS